MTRISFIIPVYNGDIYLRNCIDSILRVLPSQLFTIEIVLIDDGSADFTAELCDRYASSVNILSAHQKNHGVSNSRNLGISVATGQYVIFVDADDEIDGEKLKKLFEEFLNEQNADVAIYGVVFQAYNKGKRFSENSVIPSMNGVLKKSECIRNINMLFSENCLSSACNKIIRRDILLQYELLFNEQMFLFEDLEFSLRLLNVCEQITFFQSGVYIYRQQIDSHYGNRYKRIKHVSEIATPIRDAVSPMCPDDCSIPLTIYLWVARDVLFYIPFSQIKDLCIEFRAWICKNSLEDKIIGNDFAMSMYHGRVAKLIKMRAMYYAKSKIKTLARQLRSITGA